MWRKVCVCVRIGARNALGPVFPPVPSLSAPNAPPFGWSAVQPDPLGDGQRLVDTVLRGETGEGGLVGKRRRKQNARRRGPLPPLSYRRSRRLRVSRNRLLAGGRGCLAAAAGGFQLEGGEGDGGRGDWSNEKSHTRSPPCPPRPSPAYLVLVGGSELDARGAQAEHPRRGTNKKKRRAGSAATLHNAFVFFSFAAPPSHPAFLAPPMLATALRGLLASPAAAPSQRAVAAVAVRGYHKNVSAQRAARRRVLPCRPSPPPRVPRARARRVG